MITKIFDAKIQAPVKQIFVFYANPDHLKESWRHDIVKESKLLSSLIKVKNVLIRKSMENT